MALAGWEAGELWQQLRDHSDETGWCQLDRRRGCSAAGYARTELTAAGLLEPRPVPDLVQVRSEWRDPGA